MLNQNQYNEIEADSQRFLRGSLVTTFILGMITVIVTAPFWGLFSIGCLCGLGLMFWLINWNKIFSVKLKPGISNLTIRVLGIAFAFIKYIPAVGIVFLIVKIGGLSLYGFITGFSLVYLALLIHAILPNKK